MIKEKILKYKTQKKGVKWIANKLNIGAEDVRVFLKSEDFTCTNVKKPEYTITYSKAVVPKVGAKILLLDIETSPLLAYVYQKQVWKARIGAKQVESDWFMLTWAAKWHGEQEVFSDSLTSEEALSEDDERIVTSLWLLLDEADIIVAHNGNQFDIPNINTRCVLHKLPPPSPYKQIDTLKIAQQQFGFTHSSLDALAGFFGVDGKTETGFQLWKDCIHGKEEALMKMEVYNRNDVVVLEKIYNFLKPYAKGHPNLDLYVDTESPQCPSCGKDKLVAMDGKYFYTQAVRYPIYRCSGCQAISRAKKGDAYTNKKLISAIPR